ncbi:transglutaminaseTgpA domain-containing protein [Microbacterium sp. NPDC056234]|uniref:transglutaminase family protein n=1 Tax=Microbacterium sp. NPDC056234 TaxID=3345757 RepID=UPI0035E32112
MSRVETPTGAWAMDVEPSREGIVGRSLLAAFAAVVALWPYVPVVQAGQWTLIVGTLIFVVTLAGAIVRVLMADRPALARTLTTLLVQLAASVFLLTAMLLPQTALLGVLPTPATATVFAELAVQAGVEVYNGSAPLPDTLALRTVIGTAFAIVIILIDLLIAHRRALPAAVLVTVVGALPIIITLGEANVAWFVVLAVLILMLLRSSAGHDRRSARRTSTALMAGVGVGAIALTVVVAPTLPVSASWMVPGSGVTVDASLRLGDDLRRPNATQVMSLATTSETAPYLRIATLSRFDGDVWRPDREATQSLSEGFGDPEWNEEFTGDDRRTSIRVLGLSSSRLPVPYPAERLVGVSAGWEVMPSNRTVVSDVVDASGRDYTVTSAIVQPTFEQVAATSAAGGEVDTDEITDLPAIIPQTAAEVTADSASDYEKLIALQNWFRSEFEYSIDTPVEEDFDGTGTDAVATFLEVRSGYCVHFAGAFALMAKTLGMPVRIVVGYLPGQLTDEKRGDDYVYAVMSDQLHAWPEVHFNGIGWVPFEPTATLGTPTAFARGATTGGTGSGPGQTPTPTTAPSAAPSDVPTIAPENPDEALGGDVVRQRLDPTPVLLTVGAILIVLLLPLAARSLRRAARAGRARHGDAASAWLELRDTMVDLGLNPSDAQSPRVRAAELARERGADPASLGVLVHAIERASYARTAPGRPARDAEDLAEPLHRVLGQLHASVDARSRFGALFAPRSLFVARPTAPVGV